MYAQLAVYLAISTYMEALFAVIFLIVHNNSNLMISYLLNYVSEAVLKI